MHWGYSGVFTPRGTLRHSEDHWQVVQWSIYPILMPTCGGHRPIHPKLTDYRTIHPACNTPSMLRHVWVAYNYLLGSPLFARRVAELLTRWESLLIRVFSSVTFWAQNPVGFAPNTIDYIRLLTLHHSISLIWTQELWNTKMNVFESEVQRWLKTMVFVTRRECDRKSLSLSPSCESLHKQDQRLPSSK
jgi:hypothetical protein